MLGRKRLYENIVKSLNITRDDVFFSKIEEIPSQLFLLYLLELIFNRPITAKFETDCYKCLKLINQFSWPESPELQIIIEIAALTNGIFALLELIKQCNQYSEKIDYLTRIIEIRSKISLYKKHDLYDLIEFLQLCKENFNHQNLPSYIAAELADACVSPGLTAFWTKDESEIFWQEISIKENNFRKALKECLSGLYQNLPAEQKNRMQHLLKDDKSLCRESINFDSLMVFLKQHLFQQAAAENNIEKLTTLLYETINHHADRHFALKIAVTRGHQQIVEALLSYYNKNGVKFPEEAVMLAAEFGRLEILKLLDRWGGKMNAQNDMPFILACQNGHKDTAQFLLEHKALDDQGMLQYTVDPAAQENLAFCEAAETGHINIIKLLLQNKKTDPCAQNNFPLQAACAYGYEKIVEILMADSRINPDNRCMKLAYKRNYPNIMAILLSNPLVTHLTLKNGQQIFPCNIVENTFFFPAYRNFKYFKSHFEEKDHENDLNADVIHHIGCKLFQEINFPLSFLFRKPTSACLKQTSQVKNRIVRR